MVHGSRGGERMFVDESAAIIVIGYVAAPASR
jgi:hypothetical protein